jgi:hypothetical protein
MSLSCFGLRQTFEREYSGLRNAGKVAILPPGFRLERTEKPDLYALITEAQNRFKAPHLRDYGYRMPVPFRWGPNGSLILLGILMGGYALAIVITLAAIVARETFWLTP